MGAQYKCAIDVAANIAFVCLRPSAVWDEVDDDRLGVGMVAEISQYAGKPVTVRLVRAGNACSDHQYLGAVYSHGGDYTKCPCRAQCLRFICAMLVALAMAFKYNMH